MPIAVTNPGVHLEELESGQHSITSAATSIAAFVGRAPIGATDIPVTIFNYGDFTRAFGGLKFDYPMSYAVQDFFANGGSQAVIARLFEPAGNDGVAKLEFPLSPPAAPDGRMLGADAAAGAASLALAAANPGAWGNFLSAAADNKGITGKTAQQFFQEYGLRAEDLFNLTLTLNNAQGKVVNTERYLNLTVSATGKAAAFPNRIDRVLAAQSTLARLAGALPALPPGNGAIVQGVGGDDGTYLTPATYIGDPDGKTGIYLLKHMPSFNLLCIPPDRRILPDVPEGEQDLDPAVHQAAATLCADQRAFYIVDPPVAWKDLALQGQIAQIVPETIGIAGQNASGVEVARNAAVYFPRIWKEDILMKSQQALFTPCGAIAGVMAATDVSRGVWKAPAGTAAQLANVTGLEVNLTDDEDGHLNPLGINCLRNLPTFGPVVWGARTLRGADSFADDYKYVPVRRLALFIENSLIAGTQWAVFEPNDEVLWSSLRLSVGSFLAELARQGAFFDYSVRCDATTTTQDDIDQGIVNIMVSIAPVKPDEFVVISIQQVAGATPS